MRKPIDHCQRALLIGLQCQPQAVITSQSRIAIDPLEHIERQFQALTFLGIDGQANAGSARGAGQRQEARRQLGQHPPALRGFVTRVQRRQLDRDAVTGAAQRRDRCVVGVEVVLRGGTGHCRLAQHVEGTTGVCLVRLAAALEAARAAALEATRAAHLAAVLDCARASSRSAARQRLGNAASGHEFLRDDAHRPGDDQTHRRDAAAGEHFFERSKRRFTVRHSSSSTSSSSSGVAVAVTRTLPVRQAPGQYQRPGAGIDKHRIAASQMPPPVAL